MASPLHKLQIHCISIASSLHLTSTHLHFTYTSTNTCIHKRRLSLCAVVSFFFLCVFVFFFCCVSEWVCVLCFLGWTYLHLLCGCKWTYAPIVLWLKNNSTVASVFGADLQTVKCQTFRRVRKCLKSGEWTTATQQDARSGRVRIKMGRSRKLILMSWYIELGSVIYFDVT